MYGVFVSDADDGLPGAWRELLQREAQCVGAPGGAKHGDRGHVRPLDTQNTGNTLHTDSIQTVMLVTFVSGI